MLTSLPFGPRSTGPLLGHPPIMVHCFPVVESIYLIQDEKNQLCSLPLPPTPILKPLRVGMTSSSLVPIPNIVMEVKTN